MNAEDIIRMAREAEFSDIMQKPRAWICEDKSGFYLYWKYHDPLESEKWTPLYEAKSSEPVAWMVYTNDGKDAYITSNPNEIAEWQRALPLYTSQQI